jgi:hypothetical protein
MKTNCWFNRNRLLSHLPIATAGTLFSAAAAVALLATAPASSAYAEDHQFTVVYQITDIVDDPNDSTMRDVYFQGKGYSSLLGAFTVTAVGVTPQNQVGCDPIDATVTITAEGGTIEIREMDVFNCPTTLAGTWEVAGGTGQFSGVTGGGTTRGTGNAHGINARLVVVYAGSLSLN